MQKIHLSTVGLFLCGMLIGFISCEHDPVGVEGGLMPIDTTTNPIDTTVVNPPDTSSMNDDFCSPDSVYFNLQILPILRSNCNFFGCHSSFSAADDVILENYETTFQTADVRPFNLEGSDLYSVLVTENAEKIMPPPPRSPLSSEQIALVSVWISQGAENLDCNPGAAGCDTVDVRYSTFVEPVIIDHCRGCHSGPTPEGGVDLSTYERVKEKVDAGLLHGVIAWLDGFVTMPKGGARLPQCTIDKIKSWIDSGAQNN